MVCRDCILTNRVVLNSPILLEGLQRTIGKDSRYSRIRMQTTILFLDHRGTVEIVRLVFFILHAAVFSDAGAEVGGL